MTDSLSPKTVLVVEDDHDARRAIASLLETEGLAVATAGDGQEALDYLHRCAPPAAIVLDLMMPSMDGWQFREQQRSDPILASIPVVIVSALPDSAEEREHLETAYYISKPVDGGQLVESVRRAMDGADAVTIGAVGSH